MTSRMPARMINKLLQPQPAQGPYGPCGLKKPPPSGPVPMLMMMLSTRAESYPKAGSMLSARERSAKMGARRVPIKCGMRQVKSELNGHRP